MRSKPAPVVYGVDAGSDYWHWVKGRITDGGYFEYEAHASLPVKNEAMLGFVEAATEVLGYDYLTIEAPFAVPNINGKTLLDNAACSNKLYGMAYALRPEGHSGKLLHLTYDQWARALLGWKGRLSPPGATANRFAVQISRNLPKDFGKMPNKKSSREHILNCIGIAYGGWLVGSAKLLEMKGVV